VRRPKAVWVNTGLAVLLAGAGLGAYLSIGDPPKAQLTAGRRVTVAAGTVTSTVGGTGNAASASSVGVDFAGSGGTLTALYVQPGQKVTAGQPLARIDTTSAQQTLQTAQAQLASAQAQYDQTANGATAVQRQKDQLAIRSAQLSLNAANSSLTEAKQQLATDTAQQNQLVAQAQADLRAGTGTQAQLSQAEQTRTATLAKDRQAITQAQQQVAGARTSSPQRLTATANATPTASAVAGRTPSWTAPRSRSRRPEGGRADLAEGSAGRHRDLGCPAGSSGGRRGWLGSGLVVGLGCGLVGLVVGVPRIRFRYLGFGLVGFGLVRSTRPAEPARPGAVCRPARAASFIVIADLAVDGDRANIAEADAASVRRAKTPR
jgi:multidrug efflux pump subunit AcrA (membrane-fusion protein)